MSSWIVPPGSAIDGPILELERGFNDCECPDLDGATRDAFRSGRILLLRDAILRWGKIGEKRTKPYVDEFFRRFGPNV